MSVLKNALEKYGLHPNDVSLFLDTLSKFTEGEWFLPTNAKENHYTICMELHVDGFICHKMIPVFSESTEIGRKHYFLYKHDLNYKNI